MEVVGQLLAEELSRLVEVREVVACVGGGLAQVLAFWHEQAVDALELWAALLEPRHRKLADDGVVEVALAGLEDLALVDVKQRADDSLADAGCLGAKSERLGSRSGDIPNAGCPRFRYQTSFPQSGGIRSSRSCESSDFGSKTMTAASGSATSLSARRSIADVLPEPCPRYEQACRTCGRQGEQDRSGVAVSDRIRVVRELPKARRWCGDAHCPAEGFAVAVPSRASMPRSSSGRWHRPVHGSGDLRWWRQPWDR